MFKIVDIAFAFVTIVSKETNDEEDEGNEDEGNDDEDEDSDEGHEDEGQFEDADDGNIPGPSGLSGNVRDSGMRAWES